MKNRSLNKKSSESLIQIPAFKSVEINSEVDGSNQNLFKTNSISKEEPLKRKSKSNIKAVKKI